LSQLLEKFFTDRTDWPSEQSPLHVYLEGIEDDTWVEVDWPESARDQ
jgi:hypothetical protein